MRAAFLVLFLALPLAAQTKPELSTTEKAALQYLLDKQAENAKTRAALEAAEKEVATLTAQVQAETAKTHPGYHLQLNPIALVKDEKK